MKKINAGEILMFFKTTNKVRLLKTTSAIALLFVNLVPERVIGAAGGKPDTIQKILDIVQVNNPEYVAQMVYGDDYKTIQRGDYSFDLSKSEVMEFANEKPIYVFYSAGGQGSLGLKPNYHFIKDANDNLKLIFQSYYSSKYLDKKPKINGGYEIRTYQRVLTVEGLFNKGFTKDVFNSSTHFSNLISKGMVINLYNSLDFAYFNPSIKSKEQLKVWLKKEEFTGLPDILDIWSRHSNIKLDLTDRSSDREDLYILRDQFWNMKDGKYVLGKTVFKVENLVSGKTEIFIKYEKEFASRNWAKAWSYTVDYDDTLFSLSKRTGISLDELVQQNNIKKPNHIEVGQVLLFNAKTRKMQIDDH